MGYVKTQSGMRGEYEGLKPPETKAELERHRKILIKSMDEFKTLDEFRQAVDTINAADNLCFDKDDLPHAGELFPPHEMPNRGSCPVDNPDDKNIYSWFNPEDKNEAWIMSVVQQGVGLVKYQTIERWKETHE